MSRWQRTPQHDTRFAWGDDFASDAWMRNEQIRRVAVGFDPNDDLSDLSQLITTLERGR